MSPIDKKHIEYHLAELAKQCDNSIRKVTCLWADQNLTSVWIYYPGAARLTIDTAYEALPECISRVMKRITEKKETAQRQPTNKVKEIIPQ